MDTIALYIVDSVVKAHVICIFYKYKQVDLGV